MLNRDDLKRRIERYRFLEVATADPEMKEILAKLIAEIEIELLGTAVAADPAA